MLVLRWSQRAHCWFWGRPKGHIRAPKGHSALWKRPSENPVLWVLAVPRRACQACVYHSRLVYSLASFPGSCAGEEEREPGTHCSRMRQVPLVTCILLRYTKITVNFCLPPERPHCMVILPVGHIRAILKSKTISL